MNILPCCATFLVCAGLGAATQESLAVPRYTIEARLVGHTIVSDVRIEAPEAWVTGDGTLRVDPASAGSTDAGFRLRGVRTGDCLDSAYSSDPGGLIELAADGWLYLRPAEHESTEFCARYYIDLDPDDLGLLGYYLLTGNGSAEHWYPQIVGEDGTRPQFSDFVVTITRPDSLAVLATGSTDQTSVSAPGLDMLMSRHVAEHMTGFALAIAPNHDVLELSGSSIVISVLAPRNDKDTWLRIGEQALSAATYYSELYGFTPLSSIGILPGPTNFIGGFPMPGVFMIHRGDLRPQYVEFITAHELAHYYWGLYVFGEDERLDWLNLAMGIWADQVYLADRHGRPLDEQWRMIGNGSWMLDFLTAQVAGREQRIGLKRGEENGLGFDYHSQIRHGKGATGLYLMARLMGSDQFLEVQRSILQDFQYQPLPIDSLINRMEAAGATWARQFIDQWMRGDATIGYAVAEAGPRPDGSGWRVIIERTGTVAYPIEVELIDADETSERFVVDSRASHDTLDVNMAPPVIIRLDPDGVVPMWNSDHVLIRRLFLHALDRAGLTEPFITMATEHLKEADDPALLRRVLERLRASGRETEATRLEHMVILIDSD